MRRMEHRLAGGPEAAGRARRALDELAADLTPSVLEDLRLLVSELVTNSVRHAGVGSGSEILLVVKMDERVVRVEVIDRGPGFERKDTAPSLYQTSGWGLYFVGEIADRWGVFQDHGTHVWFELDLDGRTLIRSTS